MVVKKGKRSKKIVRNSKKIVRNSKKRSVKKGGKRSSRRSKSIISKKISKKGGADMDPGVASASGTPREGASALPHQQLAAWMAQNGYISQPPQQLQSNQPDVVINLE